MIHTILLSLALAMMQPNASGVVNQVAAGRDLSTADAQHRFADDVVCELHKLDPRWGHLKKNPGQTQVHGHAEDAVLWLADQPGQSVAVDFIGSAGSSAARPTWQPDSPRYSASDWISPINHNGCTASSPVPTPPSQPPNAPVDLSAIEKSLEGISTTLVALAAQLDAIRAEQARVGDRVEIILQSTDRIIQTQLNPHPEYRGRVLGFAVTLRPVQP